jgi:hypothetical protein
MKLIMTEKDLYQVIETMDGMNELLNTWEEGCNIRGFPKDALLRFMRAAGHLSGALGNTVGNIASNLDEGQPREPSIYDFIERTEPDQGAARQ